MRKTELTGADSAYLQKYSYAAGLPSVCDGIAELSFCPKNERPSHGDNASRADLGRHLGSVAVWRRSIIPGIIARAILDILTSFAPH